MTGYVCIRAVLILLAFGVTTSLLGFVPPFAAGQFAIFGIQVTHLLHISWACKPMSLLVHIAGIEGVALSCALGQGYFGVPQCGGPLLLQQHWQ